MKQTIELDAAAAIRRVNALYAGADRGAETLDELHLLAAHLNQLWPDSLQQALPAWIAAPEPDGDDGSWRQMHVFWVSLYKKKRELEHRHQVLRDYCKLVDDFQQADEKAIDARLLKDLYVDAYSSRDAAAAGFNRLRIAAVYYRAKDEGLSGKLEEYMRGLLRWYFYNPAIAVDPAIVAIHLVHTEGLENADPGEAKALIESPHLGWMSWWHLFQLNDAQLEAINTEDLNCSEDARVVLDVLANR